MPRRKDAPAAASIGGSHRGWVEPCPHMFAVTGDHVERSRRGAPVQLWPWEDAGLDEMELAYRRMRAMFEFLDKLGVDYWCFHDRCTTPAAPPEELRCTAL